MLPSSGPNLAEGDGRAEKEGGGGTVSLGFGATLAFGEADGLPPVVGAGELFAVAVGAGLFL